MNLEMVCVCSIDGVREIEALRLQIFRRMGLSDPKDLTTAIVLSLAFDFQCDAYIAADQWFGLSVETPLVPDGVHVECDHPADGLAVVWERLADRFPERVSVARNGEPGSLQPVAKASNTRLAHYEALYAKKEEHYATHGNDYVSGCDDCKANMSLSCAARVAMNEAWGLDVLEPAIEAAYS